MMSHTRWSNGKFPCPSSSYVTVTSVALHRRTLKPVFKEFNQHFTSNINDIFAQKLRQETKCNPILDHLIAIITLIKISPNLTTHEKDQVLPYL